MKSSDPKQVAILSLVAISAIGYLGFTLLGSGQKAAMRMAAREQTAESEAEGEAVASQELLRDSFTHPVLIRNRREEQQKASLASAPPAPLGGKATSGASGFMWPSGIGPLRVTHEGGEGAAELPADSTGLNRKSVEAPRPTVSLSAVVKVERAMAFLSINGKESLAFRAGDLVAPGLRLVAIAADSVTLRTPRKVVELKLGEEKAL